MPHNNIRSIDELVACSLYLPRRCQLAVSHPHPLAEDESGEQEQRNKQESYLSWYHGHILSFMEGGRGSGGAELPVHCPLFVG
jgi:hypothetical protein